MSLLQLFSPSSFHSILCFVFVILVKIQLSLSNPCFHPFNCWNVTVHYPFWGGDQPPYCGHPDLKINCEENGTTATMMMKSVKYRVLNVNYGNQVLKIARYDNMGEMICRPDHLETPIDSALFNYTSTGYEKLNLSYSCSLARRLEQCYPDDVTYKDGFILTTDVHTSAKCNGYNSVNVLVPKNLLVEAKQNLLTLEQVLKEGFDVKWMVDPTCSKCRNSKNFCGYNSPSKEPVCDCSNPQSPLVECTIYPERKFPAG